MDVRRFSIPWGAVYAADRENPSIIGSGFDADSGKVIPGGPAFGRSTSPWKLYSLFTSGTRYWAASTARFTIVRPILPTKDGIFAQRISVEKELMDLGLPTLEDCIAIETGYANSLYSDTNLNVRGRVFTGYIETINVSISVKGVKVTMNCRDAMRFLIENKFSGQIFGSDFKIYQQTGFDSFRNGAAVPLDLGEVAEALKISRGDLTGSMIAGGLEKHKIMAWLIYAGSNGGCLPGVLIENGKPLPGGAVIEKSVRPVMAPKDAFGSVQGFNVMNRFPLEVLKHIGSLEAEPRELFADVDTGRISWVRRETARMDDPWQFCALIPFPDGPMKGQPPNVLSAQSDWSTIGTISELVVVNPVSEVAGADKALAGSGVLNVSGRLPDNRFFPQFIGLAFHKIRHFVRRTRYIFDDTIAPGQPELAKSLIDAMFRIWGKDLRAGTFETFGNPAIRCGDAVQNWNFGLFDGDIFRAEAVEHSLIASGPRRGYRTRVAWAGTDEERVDALSKTKAAVENAPNGLNTFYMNDDPSERGSIRRALGEVRVTTVGEGTGGQF